MVDFELTVDTGLDLTLDSDDVRLSPDGTPATDRASSEGRTGERPTPEDAERAAEDEVNEVLRAFKERAGREDRRFVDATDSEFWIAVCFQTREQKEEFLRKSGWINHGDKYLDGMRVAHEMGITLESPVPQVPQHRQDWRLLDLT